MFDKLMNSYYYGKSGKGDYTPDDLPKNRWQLFMEMLRTRMSGLCRMNLMYFVAWLPAMIAIALCVVSLIMTLAGTVQVDETGAVIDAIDQTALREAMRTSNDMIFVTLLILIPCIAITGPFTAGLSYVTNTPSRGRTTRMPSRQTGSRDCSSARLPAACRSSSTSAGASMVIWRWETPCGSFRRC